jgi:multiple sugar transport system substrate-binding protein
VAFDLQLFAVRDVQHEGGRVKGPLPAVLVAAGAALALAGCGYGETSGGARTLNWYVFNEPGGAYEQAVATCNEKAGGRYRLNYVRLPTDANQQRELVVRRLAAKDSDIDIIGMDVIWTAEFAEAEWILPWTGERQRTATEGKLEGPLKTVQYKGRVWAAPFTTNTQLLWYRKDIVKTPPTTWDEMVDEARRQGKSVEVQGNQYEGLAVWANALIAGAGGEIVDQEGNVKVDDTTSRAAEVMQKLGENAAPPGMATNKEDEARLGFESGRSNFEINYSFIYPSAADVSKEFQAKIGWARYPRTDPDKPSRPPLGGINLGIGAYTENRELAFDAATCLASAENQVVASEKGGLPPTTESAFEDPKLKKAFPFADLLRESIEEGAPRPVNPAYSDISLAIQKTFHPPGDLAPGEAQDTLKDRLQKAADGKIF